MRPTAVLASALVRPAVVLTTEVPGGCGGGDGDGGGDGGGGDEGGGGGEGGGRASPWNKVGLIRSVVVPSPSWPSTFLPQHLRSELLVTYAHVW